MTERADTSTGAAAGDDADVSAVRRMMAAQGPDQFACADAKPGRRVKRAREQLRERLNTALKRSAQPAEDTPRQDTTKREPARIAGGIANFVIGKVKSYRPERKRILGTSAVLLLILKPFFVLGWSLAAMVAVICYYLAVGSDRFWRKVLSLFSLLQKWCPDFARSLKLRAYVLGRRWDRVLLELPTGLADTLRGPDLRRVLAADAEHDAAVTDRLSRLDKDSIAG